MFSIFKKKEKPSNNDRLDPETRNEGLEKGRAFIKFISPYSITHKYYEDLGLDKVKNETGFDWYVLKKDVNPKEALGKLAEFRGWMSENTLYGFKCDEEYLYRFNGKAAVLLDSCEDEELFMFCQEHDITLFTKEGGTFINCGTKERYHLDVATYPGSADDAATYGDVELIKDKEL